MWVPVIGIRGEDNLVTLMQFMHMWHADMEAWKISCNCRCIFHSCSLSWMQRSLMKGLGQWIFGASFTITPPACIMKGGMRWCCISGCVMRFGIVRCVFSYEMGNQMPPLRPQLEHHGRFRGHQGMGEHYMYVTLAQRWRHHGLTLPYSHRNLIPSWD